MDTLRERMGRHNRLAEQRQTDRQTGKPGPVRIKRLEPGLPWTVGNVERRKEVGKVTYLAWSDATANTSLFNELPDGSCKAGSHV